METKRNLSESSPDDLAKIRAMNLLHLTQEDLAKIRVALRRMSRGYLRAYEEMLRNGEDSSDLQHYLDQSNWYDELANRFSLESYI